MGALACAIQPSRVWQAPDIDIPHSAPSSISHSLPNPHLLPYHSLTQLFSTYFPIYHSLNFPSLSLLYLTHSLDPHLLRYHSLTPMFFTFSSILNSLQYSALSPLSLINYLKGWEQTFLIRGIGLSNKSKIGYGFVFSDICL